MNGIRITDAGNPQEARFFVKELLQLSLFLKASSVGANTGSSVPLSYRSQTFTGCATKK
jgi:hypothetical protein